MEDTSQAKVLLALLLRTFPTGSVPSSLKIWVKFEMVKNRDSQILALTETNTTVTSTAPRVPQA
ncbi:hypothetical protein MUK42_31224 [Musa troglodytarum]|uniref:Uncharacterized protein n=1 Tax=Musa troglodytarum TaxID=320322 RepID=A0A9E7FA74_9LILI|nr:hypothetical protein MUK42_31224 [Musa troglodytarum]